MPAKRGFHQRRPRLPFPAGRAVAWVVLCCLLPGSMQAQAGPPGSPASSQVMLEALSDTMILEGYPDSGCGDGTELWNGYDDYLYPNGKVVRSLLRFDLSAIPPGATISQATLQMYFYASWDVEYITRTITTTRVTAPWAENTLGWAGAPDLAGFYGSVQLAQQNAPSWVSWDITSLVAGWHSGAIPNYGLALRGPEHAGKDSSWKSFASSETGYYPRLSISYEIPTGDVIPLNRTTRLPVSLENGFSLYLPLIQQQNIVDIDLHPIDNDGGEGTYTITWTPYTKEAAIHQLQEWSGDTFQTIYSDAAGTNLFQVSGKAPGTYRYRLSAPVSWGTVYSQERQVTVSDLPLETAYLTIGIGSYPAMLPPSSTTPDPRLGITLHYPLYDSAEAWELLLVLGKGPGNGSAQHILSLNERGASKQALREAITGWLDGHESSQTTVVIFFSGHSLQGPDLPPYDEVDGLDEYLAPYDLACSPCSTPATWQLDTAIRDDELASWLSELASQRVVLILDTSFGYGLIDDLSRPGYMLLVSNQAGQMRWESGGVKNGVFSGFLFQALSDLTNDFDHNGWVAIEEIFNSVASQVNNYVYELTKNIFGGPFYQHPYLYDNIPAALDLTKPPNTTQCPIP